MCTAELDMPAVLQVISGGQEVVLPSGVKYKDIKIGGGSKPTKGYLMVVDFRFVAIYAPLASQQRPKLSKTSLTCRVHLSLPHKSCCACCLSASYISKPETLHDWTV